VQISRKEIVRTNVSSQKDNDSAFQRSTILSIIVHNMREKLCVWKLKFASFQTGSVYTDAMEKARKDAENTSSAILTRL